MNERTEVWSDGVQLAKLVKQSLLWKTEFCFFSDDKDFVQVGTWNYSRGKHLKAHIHNEVSRTIDRTQEVLIVQSGSLMASIYNDLGEFVETLIVGSGDILILISGGHGYEILSDDTRVIEIKNGPYLGADIDRRRI